MFWYLKLAASVQVAFGPAPGSSPSLRSYGNNRGVNTGKISDSTSKVSARGRNVKTPSTAIDNDECMIEASDDATDASTGKIKEGQYMEPWVSSCYNSSCLLLSAISSLH